jgi:hypothetical protein
MLVPMNRLLCTLVYVLIAAQAMAFSPMTPELTRAQADPGSQMACGDAMPAGGDSDPCPCCPDGVMDAAACLSACTAMVGAISTFAAFVPGSASEPIIDATTLPRLTNSDPPLDPPPIA